MVREVIQGRKWIGCHCMIKLHKTKVHMLVFLVNFIHQKCYAVWTFLNLLVSTGELTLNAYSLSDGQIGASSKQR